MTTRFYSFRLDDAGLVRLAEPGPVLAYVDRDRGGWVDEPDLLRHLVKGTIEFEQVDPDQALVLADRYGVGLDSDPLALV
jgi:hypothetical protein